MSSVLNEFMNLFNVGFMWWMNPQLHAVFPSLCSSCLYLSKNMEKQQVLNSDSVCVCVCYTFPAEVLSHAVSVTVTIDSHWSCCQFTTSICLVTFFSKRQTCVGRLVWGCFSCQGHILSWTAKKLKCCRNFYRNLFQTKQGIKIFLLKFEHWDQTKPGVTAT